MPHLHRQNYHDLPGYELLACFASEYSLIPCIFYKKAFVFIVRTMSEATQASMAGRHVEFRLLSHRLMLKENLASSRASKTESSIGN